MRIGCHIWEPGPLTGNLDKLNQYSGTVLQTFIGDQTKFFPYDYCDADLEEFKRRKEREGIFVVVHGPFVVNLAHSKRLKLGIKSVIEHLKVCEKLGADAFVLHPGSWKDESEKEAIYHLTRSINAVLAAVPGNCMLLLENTAGGGTTAGHMDIISRVVRSICVKGKVQKGRLGVCFDTAHGWADGMELNDPEWTRSFFMTHKDVIRLIHLNNPDLQVKCGSHRDRHSLSWGKSLFSVDIMLDLVESFEELNIPMVMEAKLEAYPENFEILDEWEFMRCGRK